MVNELCCEEIVVLGRQLLSFLKGEKEESTKRVGKKENKRKRKGKESEEESGE